MKNTLEIIDLSFSYYENNGVFNNLNFKYTSGDIIGIYGNNGSGKTTLINCLSGFYLPTKGKVLLNNKVPDKCRQNIAIIDTDMDLIEYITLEDNIKFFMDFYHITYRTDEVDLLLVKYEIKSHKNKYVFEASEGMLRKTQIITAFLMKPKLFLADEPVDGLDEKSREIFFDDIKELSHNIGTIPIFSLHDERLLKEKCTHIIYL